MNKTIALVLIGLFLTFGAGFVAGLGSQGLEGHEHASATSDAHDDGHDHDDAADHSDAMTGHDHSEIISLEAGANAPTLDFEITADPASGWNLHILTTGFEFTPESASLAHVAGEGHAHIYVNGHKIARAYGPWFHIASLPEGEAHVTVSLNANDHSALAVGEEVLTVTRIVDVAH